MRASSSKCTKHFLRGIPALDTRIAFAEANAQGLEDRKLLLDTSPTLEKLRVQS